MRDVDKAIRDFEECIEKNLDDTESRLLIIQTLLDSGKFDQAIESTSAISNIAMSAHTMSRFLGTSANCLFLGITCYSDGSLLNVLKMRLSYQN